MFLLDFDTFNGWHFPPKISLMDFQIPLAFIIPLQMGTPAEAHSRYMMTTVGSLMYLLLGILWSLAV